MNCRGHARRVAIVNEYEIICEAHIRLLNGQTIRSDAEREIEHDYYVFICNHKEHGNKEKIICGGTAARDLLSLTNQVAPPIFNMLHEFQEQHGGHGGGQQGSTKMQWNPAAKQLYDAIMILIIAWNLKPGPIYDYLDEAMKYHNCEPFAYRINRINKILKRRGVTMQDIVESLRNSNPDLRNYEFGLLSDILNRENIESFFD